jgi:hypothetical protein
LNDRAQFAKPLAGAEPAELVEETTVQIENLDQVVELVGDNGVAVKELPRGRNRQRCS